MLPPQVLLEVQQELLDYKGCGVSVIELSHRDSIFRQILEDAEADLRKLLKISDDYAVLFLQGGASAQFSMIPLHLGRGAYLLTGYWSRKAYEEAKKLSDPVIHGNCPRDGNIKYLYLCENETVQGTRIPVLPETGLPIISDQSSIFLTGPCEINKYGMIFAGAQKNVGPAGVTIVIIRKELLERTPILPPSCLDYQTQAKANSLYNTPNCWGIYICGKVFRRLLRTGGLEAAEKRRTQRGKLLYDFLDQSSLFRPMVTKEFRSPTNVTFSTGSPIRDAHFLSKATDAGFMGLAGHKSQGGIRASLYNAMPVEGVDALVEFLRKYEKEESSSEF